MGLSQSSRNRLIDTSSLSHVPPHTEGLPVSPFISVCKAASPPDTPHPNLLLEQTIVDFRNEINLEDECIHEPIKGS